MDEFSNSEALAPLSTAESSAMRDHTDARVALTRTGTSLSTKDTLDFALAHALARDAVHTNLSLPSLLDALRSRDLHVIAVKSAALDRPTYLRRPDLGRTLDQASLKQILREQLLTEQSSREQRSKEPQANSYSTPKLPTLVIILADGLSALAIDRHAIPLLDALVPLLTPGWHVGPVVIAEQARVALGDPIGEALHADLTLLLIGERPGLSSADSLGAYITWAPRPGRTDAERNCVSNIRPTGLDYPAAAARIATLINEARRRQLTGTALKDLEAALP